MAAEVDGGGDGGGGRRWWWRWTQQRNLNGTLPKQFFRSFNFDPCKIKSSTYRPELFMNRWDGKGLCGHGRIIFEALDGLVTDIAMKHLRQQGSDITNNLRDIWRETFGSWLVETTWSNNGYIPSTEEYLETGMISIANHTMVLPSSCFLKPNLQNHKLKPSQYEPITKSLMASSRLLNDIQSYQKEQLDGKTNLALLHLKGNSKAEIEDSKGAR
ncbi:hypothetical protein RHMOL_Rhmol02G0133100 [Rhododendron molle]|uniref:Uncharacterized protein n=1 Tax=Rhododendron molle TaxID=49168 RepID=A0ACC0PSC9_RHOML|nr:hypothetical protein RHMOL_Rhmol02G0133100 [Rhododendron molle]